MDEERKAYRQVAQQLREYVTAEEEVAAERARVEKETGVDIRRTLELSMHTPKLKESIEMLMDWTKRVKWELEEKCKRVTTRAEEAERQLDIVETERLAASKLNEQLQDSVQKIQNKVKLIIKHVENEQANLEKARDDSKNAVDLAKTERTKLETDHKAEVARNDKSILDLEARVARRDATIGRRDKSIRDLKAEVERKDEYIRKSDSNRANLRAKFEEIQETLTTIKGELEEAKSTATNAVDAENTASEIARTQELRAEKAEQNKVILQQQVDRHNKEEIAWQSTKKALQEDVSELLKLKGTKADLLSQKNALEQKITVLEADVTDKQQANSALKIEITALEAFSDLSLEAFRRLSGEKVALDSTVKTLQEEIRELQEVNQSLEAETTKLQSEKTKIDEENARIEADIPRQLQAKSELERKNSCLELKITGFEAELHRLQLANSSFEEGIANLETDVSDLEQSKSVLRYMLNKAYEARSGLQHQLNEVTKVHLDLEQNITDFEKEVSGLQHASLYLQEHIFDRERDVADLEEQALDNGRTIIVERDNLAAMRRETARLANLVRLQSENNDWNELRLQEFEQHISNLLTENAATKTSHAKTLNKAESKAKSVAGSWQGLFQDLLGSVPTNWAAFDQFRGNMQDVPALECRPSCTDWLEDVACLTVSEFTVDTLHIFRCFFRWSISVEEVWAMARLMVDCDMSSWRTILSAMLAYLELDMNRLSEADTVALLALKALVYRYLRETALEDRVKVSISINQSEHTSPLVAGLALWACSGTRLVENVSAEAIRLGLRLLKDGFELIADGGRLLRIDKDQRLSIIWPGQFEIVHGVILHLKIAGAEHFSWDILEDADEYLQTIERFDNGLIGPVARGFEHRTKP